MSHTCYKILDKNTGLYSTDGVNPSWSEAGKVWSSLATVRAHLTQYQNYYREPREIPSNWEIHMYSFTMRAPATSIREGDSGWWQTPLP